MQTVHFGNSSPFFQSVIFFKSPLSVQGDVTQEGGEAVCGLRHPTEGAGGEFHKDLYILYK